MKARLSPGVRVRAEPFGGISYVPERDDFFALDKRCYNFVQSLGDRFREVDVADTSVAKALARLGIGDVSPRIDQVAYRGPSLVGSFPELPALSLPLVVNCFTTAHCPLSCIYCHADDLMKSFREVETDRDIQNVARVAAAVPALVAVVTGGDPLSRPKRAQYLIERLSEKKAVVLDTSGVGQLGELLSTVLQYKVHMRVSLDSISPVQNQKLRPGSRQYGFGKDASRSGATSTIRQCVESRVPLTVQTVVCSLNENLDELRDLRDWLISMGVRNWVLHLAVRGGNARRIQQRAEASQKRPRGIMPSGDAHRKIARLIAESDASNLPIDIRCTDSDSVPNSVLLVGSKGDLYTEGLAANGKVLLQSSSESLSSTRAASWPYFDRSGHARRYLNWTVGQFGGKNLNDICFRVD